MSSEWLEKNMSMNLISQRGERRQYDVVVIGSGIAGLTFILEVAKTLPTAAIALITKNSISTSNSYYAQGGIAAVAHPSDSIDEHCNDTLEAGDYSGDEKVIKTIISEGDRSIQKLREWGTKFNYTDKEQPHLAQEGGHRHRRIYHHDDHTGKEMIRALTEKIHAQKNVDLFEFHCAVNLITQNKKHQPGSCGEVMGVYVLDEKKSIIHTFLAKAVILATGGAGKTYRYTTNPDVATGDGVAMAYRAGARIGNMEFYQFHPTLLYHPQHNNFLISEAVRGETGYLRLADNGERFMQRYAPDKMELSTRDIVARAIFTEIERSAYNYVYLDITHKPRDFLQSHFPNIYQTLYAHGIDMSRDMIPVVPAAHYLCGGVLSDVHGRTDLNRLYVIGEAAFTGFHGANRLASNSLLEAVVMATFAAKDCLYWLATPMTYHQEISDWDSQCVTDLRRASQINAHWRGLRGEMTSYAGIVRTEEGLKDVLQLIFARKQMIEEYYWKNAITRDLIELRNIVYIAELIVRSALKRRECRGVHYREDYPLKSLMNEETVLQFHEGYSRAVK